MDEYATSRTTSIGITLDRKHERSYHKAMNNPDATTIKVAKDTRILARVVSDFTGEVMNDLILRLLKAELEKVDESSKRRLREAKAKYNVD